MADKDRIIDKIVKLFALGSTDANTTESEMMAAITAAKRLMVKHDLHMAEVEAHMDAATTEVVRHHVVIYNAYTRKIPDFAPYDYHVARAIEYLTHTRAIVRKGRTSRKGIAYGDGYSTMQFAGTEADAELARAIYLIFLEAVRRAARQTYGAGWSATHTSYALGFAARMASRAQSMQELDLTPQETQTLALIVRDKQSMIDVWMKENTRMAPPRKVRVADHTAFANGWADGEKIDLSVTRKLR